MSYLRWLLGISAAFVLLERLFPWRKDQSALRPGGLHDVGFVALNGHVPVPGRRPRHVMTEQPVYLGYNVMTPILPE